MTQLASRPDHSVRPLPTSVHHKLLEVRERHLSLGIRTSLLAAGGVLLILMSLAVLIDSRLALREASTRAALTFTTLLVTGGVFLFACWRTWQYRRSLGQLAAHVDASLPELEERWQTLTHLGTADDPYTRQIHPVMAQLLEREATGYEPQVIPGKIINRRDFKIATIVLGIGAFMLVTFWLASPWQGTLLLTRFFLPYSQISLTKIQLEATPQILARGEAVQVTGELSGKAVRQAEMETRVDGRPEVTTSVLKLDPEDQGKFAWHLPKRQASFEYRVLAGDGKTAWNPVLVADRPEIAEAHVTLTPPAYSEKPIKTFDRIPRKASTLEGSQLDVRILTQTSVSAARLMLDSGDHIDLALQPDGWLVGSCVLQTPIEFSPLLTEPHGLENDHRPRCRIDLIADAKPSVKIVTPSNETAVRPDDKVNIEFQAKDDLGISAAELVVYQQDPSDPEQTTALTTPIDLGEKSGEQHVNGSIELDLSQFNLKDGQTLTYEVRVYDTKDTSQIPSDAQQLPMQMAQGHQAAQPSDNKASQANRDASESPEAKSQTSQSDRQLAMERKTPGSATDESGQPKGSSQPAANPLDSKTLSAQSPSDPQQASGKQSQMEMARQDAPSAATSGEDSAATSESPSRTPSSEQVAGSDKSSSNHANAPDSTSKPMASPSSSNPQLAQTPENSSSTDSDQSKLSISSQQMANSDAPADDQSPEQPSSSAGQASSPSGSDGQQMAASDSPQEGKSASPESSLSPSTGQDSSPQDSQFSQMAQKQLSNQSPSGEPSEGATPPPNPMQKRSLDTQQAQSGSSPQMKLKIDEFAGSYEGQARAKTEQAIAPALTKLDELLQTAENRLRVVMQERAQGAGWNESFDSQLTGTNTVLEASEQIVSELLARTKDTPYAFIGLQISDIGIAQISPAQDAVWTAIQVEEAARDRNVKLAWQLVLRARERLAELNQKFEEVKRDYKLAELTEQIEKMHQVYSEETMALLEKLEQENGGKPLDPRKIAEYDLDEEYLKRLQEVMALREELKAELARILAEDPRLLKRFADRVRQGSLNLRAELAELAQRQAVISEDVITYNQATDETLPAIEQALKPRRLLEASEIAQKAADLQEDFLTWLPLNYNDNVDLNLDREQNVNDGLKPDAEKVGPNDKPVNETLSEVMIHLTELTQQARQVQRDAESMAFRDLGASEATNDDEAQAKLDQHLADEKTLRESGALLYEKLQQADAEIRKFGESDNNPDITLHAVNRLGDLRELTEMTTAWLSRMDAIDASRFSHVFSVEEYRLATDTQEFTSDVAGLESSLTTALETDDLPEEIKTPVRELFTLLDQQIEPLQLTTTFALKQDDLDGAQESLVDLQQQFGQAVDLYDRIINETIKKLDEKPVSDPIAELLEDPTLEELLASLEQEDPIRKLLGIPSRPSNLQVQSDWMNPQSDSAQSSSPGSTPQSLMNLMQQERDRMRQQMENARNSALQRAKDRIAELKRNEGSLSPSDKKPWNRLVSELKEGLLQDQGSLPPEQYRQPIDQYFDIISRMGEDSDQTP